MVSENDRRDLFGTSDGREHLGGNSGVTLDLRPLARCELVRLEEDVIAHADLADVVHEGRPAQELDPTLG